MNRRLRILVVDDDQAMVELLDEWLGAEGFEVIHDHATAVDFGRGYDLAIVDVPFPRQGGIDRIAYLAGRCAKAPIIAVSATFFSGVACSGAIMQQLGVASVLPKPLSREVLLNVVRRLLVDS